MATGTVKWYSATKRFGFIEPEGGGGDVFIHASALDKSGLPDLQTGDRVEFEIGMSRGKSSAVSIKLLG